MNKLKQSIKTLALAVAGIMGIAAQAETYTWQGGDVFTPSNWSPATEGAESAVPTAADDVIYDRAEVFTLDSAEGKTLESATFTAGAAATGIHVTTNALADGTVATNTLEMHTFDLQSSVFTIAGGGGVTSLWLKTAKNLGLTVDGGSTFMFRANKYDDVTAQIKEMNLTIASNAVVRLACAWFGPVQDAKIVMIDGGALVFPDNVKTSSSDIKNSVIAVTNTVVKHSCPMNLKGESRILIGEHGKFSGGEIMLSEAGTALCVDGEASELLNSFDLTGAGTAAEIKNGALFRASHFRLKGTDCHLLVDGGTVEPTWHTIGYGAGIGARMTLRNRGVFNFNVTYEHLFLEGTNSVVRLESGSSFSVPKKDMFVGSHMDKSKHSDTTTTHVEAHAPILSIADDATVGATNSFYAVSDNADRTAWPVLHFDLTEKTKADQAMINVGWEAYLSNVVVKVDVEKGKGLSGLYKLVGVRSRSLHVAGVNIGTATDEARAEALDALVASAQLANGVTLEFGADKKSLYARVKKQGFSIIIR